ncbi:hypothetical protein JCM3775_001086 [Rhodotorula graminis]
MRCPSHALLVAPRPLRPVTAFDSSTWAPNGGDWPIHTAFDCFPDILTRRHVIARPSRSTRRGHVDDERVSTAPALDRHERMAASRATARTVVVEVDEEDDGVKVKAGDGALLAVLARSSRSASAAVVGSGEGSMRSGRRSFRPSLGSIHERSAAEHELGEEEHEAVEGTGSSEGSESQTASVSSRDEQARSDAEEVDVTPATSLALDSPPFWTDSPSFPAPSPPPAPVVSCPHFPVPLLALHPTPSPNATRPPRGPLRTLVNRLSGLSAQVRRRAASAGPSGEAARPAKASRGVWFVVEVEQVATSEPCRTEERR